ncbi:hypothetical protein DFH27DRAFT_130926 [Peziza echinospora]|nr:hypothetical protein DFH27DRAFT_130926 [Peziza echinospora]
MHTQGMQRGKECRLVEETWGGEGEVEVDVGVGDGVESSRSSRVEVKCRAISIRILIFPVPFVANFFIFSKLERIKTSYFRIELRYNKMDLCVFFFFFFFLVQVVEFPGGGQ